jgi:hypothetical protein
MERLVYHEVVVFVADLAKSANGIYATSTGFTIRCGDFDVSSPISATMISVRDSFAVLRRVTASCVKIGRTKARPSEE